MPDTAKEDFALTREQFHKEDGRQAIHLIQSFRPGEVSPELANEIGVDLARSIAPGHEVAVYTHTDREHIHNHLVINAVNSENGKKWQSGPENIDHIRRVSDELCLENGLSVIEKPLAKERFSMAEYKLAERGQPLWKDELRTSIEKAQEHAQSLDEMKSYLKEQYGIEMKIQNKNVSFLHPGQQKYCRGKTLGEAYTKEALEHEYARQDQSRTNANQPAGRQQQLDKLIFGDLGSSNSHSQLSEGPRGSTQHENDSKLQRNEDSLGKDRTRSERPGTAAEQRSQGVRGQNDSTNGTNLHSPDGRENEARERSQGGSSIENGSVGGLREASQQERGATQSQTLQDRDNRSEQLSRGASDHSRDDAMGTQFDQSDNLNKGDASSNDKPKSPLEVLEELGKSVSKNAETGLSVAGKMGGALDKIKSLGGEDDKDSPEQQKINKKKKNNRGLHR